MRARVFAALLLPLILLAIAYSGVFVHYPVSVSTSPVSPPVIFLPGSNANAQDIRGNNIIEVAISPQNTSLSITVHPTFQNNYYRNVSLIANIDIKAYNVTIRVTTPLSGYPPGSMARLLIFDSPSDGNQLASVDLLGTGDTFISQISAGGIWRIDLFIVIPEPTLPQNSTAKLLLIYSPTSEAPAQLPSPPPSNAIATANNVYLAPNDVIAPHLYAWRFDGIDDYLAPPDRVYANPAEITAITFANFLRASRDMVIYHGWGGEFHITFRNDYRYYFSVKLSNGYWYDLASDVYQVGVPVMLAGRWKAGLMELFVNTTKYSQSIPTNSLYDPGSTYKFTIGAYNRGYAWLFAGYASNVIIYTRFLLDSEINYVYSSKIIPSIAMVVFLDATFYDGTRYIDLSGRGNNAVPVNGVARVVDSSTWIYVVKSLASDNKVHLRFFPNNTVLYIYDASTNNLVMAIDFSTYSANPAGMVDDVAISLPAGYYNLVLVRR
jgi:hypothetical protein